MDKKVLTVGELRKFLENQSFDTEITFGSSKYRKRPLIFYRFKKRGDNLLQIELNEIDNQSEPISEIDCRKTVGEFLRQLTIYEDHFEITFGSNLDAVPLEYRNIEIVVGINLEQNEDPQYRVEGDK